jgi:hypothetical protein
MGQTLVIPIIIRTLAGYFALHRERSLPLDFDFSFLETLDVGEHQLVASYELQWWTGHKPKDINKVEIINTYNIKRCLKHFRKQKPEAMVLPAGAGAGGLNSSDAQSSAGAGGLKSSDAGAESTANAGKSVIAGPAPHSCAGAGVDCPCCEKYRQLLSDVLLDVIKFKQFSSVMSTSSENLLNIGIRRASTFNLLHETVILKETGGAAPPAKAKTRNISRDNYNPSSELKRLQALPPSSYKWTWGETLTNDDILKLRRIGTRPGRVPHSGYNISLAEGVPDGEDSAGPSSLPSQTGIFENLPEETTVPPPTNLQFPKYFSQPDHRDNYNPFRMSNTSLDEIQQSVSGAGNPSGTSGTGNLSGPARDSPSGPGALAELWTSGSESPNIHQSPTPDDIDDLLKLADIWQDDEENDEGNDVLQLADVWDDGLTPASDLMPASVVESSGEIDIPDPDGILGLADLWTDESDEEHGDDLIAPSYGEVSGDSTGTDILAIADQWSLHDDNPATEGIASEQGGSDFGPEDFNFLQDEMFE